MFILSFIRTCNVLLFAAVLNQLITSVVGKVPSVVKPPSHALDPTNPFLENFEKNATWNDPVLKEYFYGRSNHQATLSKKKGPTILEYKLNNPKKQTLAARAVYGPQNYGPLINFPSCLSCEGKSKRDATMSVAKNFMAEQMIQQMSIFATIGACLFYGQRPPPPRDPRSLSMPASEYACGFGGLKYRTIWHLWPNEGCDADQNYYCLNPRQPDCCWLNPLMPGTTMEERIPQSMVYFQQMSRAMALTCTDEVFILIDNENDVLVQQPDPYPSIWLTHELPALRGLYEKGIVKKLTAVRFSDKQHFDRTSALLRTAVPRDTETQDFDDLEWEHAIKRALAKKRAELLKIGFTGNLTEEHEKHLLQRRDGPCGSAADQEAPGMDYFG